MHKLPAGFGPAHPDLALASCRMPGPSIGAGGRHKVPVEFDDGRVGMDVDHGCAHYPEHPAGKETGHGLCVEIASDGFPAKLVAQGMDHGDLGCRIPDRFGQSRIIGVHYGETVLLKTVQDGLVPGACGGVHGG